MLTHTLPQIPYHRLARTATNRWWKTLLGFILMPVAYLFVVFFGSLVVFIPFMIASGSAKTPEFSPLAELGVGLGSIAIVLPLILLAAWWTQGRRPGTLSSVRGRLRWRWLLGCVLLAVPMTLLALGLAVGLYALTGSDSGDDYQWVGWATFGPALLLVFALVPFQAAAEEYLCRGWLLQSVGAFVRWRWIAIGVQTLVFALLHGVGTPWGFADLVVFGAVTGWLAIRTGGLESGIALHVVNNVLALSLAVSAVGGLTLDETAADSGWQLAVADILVIVSYGLLVRWLATRFRVETAARGPIELAGRESIEPVAAVPAPGTDRGPVLTSLSSLPDVSSSSGK
ncbi:Membrane protease YdiL, CAAX protease family [Cryptosporangium aurantiacum]|uniref:Membrane protease YdiL, CAAX protease family n=1 Tax=Cryptosporangium aurantiacum TaxID=134849 RepID=A0A1M7QRR4_9ACTN|nr:type II CAAX endopeptidase family protein [Cryptosporangium aurantiacum]SHN34107.1 Membrane protease YdiL, CAAX protease family [Cryptosporangium aurantiacum]